MESRLLEILTFCSNNGYQDEVKPFRNLTKKFRNDELLWDTMKQISTKSTMTFLMYASIRNDIERVNFLLARNSKVNIQDKYKCTALHYACANSNLEIVELLLRVPSIDVNILDKTNCSPLARAIVAKNNQKTKRRIYIIVDRLIKAGANINWVDYYNNNLLLRAFNQMDSNIVKILIKAGVDINHQNKLGITPLMLSVNTYYNHMKSITICKILLKAGAKVSRVNKENDSALTIACTNKFGKAINMLIKAGSMLNNQNNNGESVLHICCNKYHAFDINIFIRAGANVNLQNNYGETPLHQAIENRNMRNVKKLLMQDVCPCYNSSDSSGNTALMCLINLDLSNDRKYNIMKRTVFIDRLITLSPDINLTNRNLQTALHFLCEWGNDPENIIKLLNAGSNINMKDAYDRTPLYNIVSSYKWRKAHELNSYYEIIEILVRNGANINIQCEEGKTIPMIAYLNKDINTIMIFKSLSPISIDYDIKDTNGLDLYKYVKDYESWKDQQSYDFN